MNRRRFSTAALSLAAVAALLPRVAAAQGGPAEGRDFTRIDPPQPTAAPGKVEVIEFFSYACPHCNTFEPALASWAQRLPADVTFRRVPVPFLMNAENFQRTYFALEATGEIEKMQQKVFTAVHVEKMRLDSPEAIAALVARSGGDAAKFLAAFKSFSVANAVTRAKKMTADYKMGSVPSIVVQGRYLTSPAQAGGTGQALAVTEALIQRARKELKP